MIASPKKTELCSYVVCVTRTYSKKCETAKSCPLRNKISLKQDRKRQSKGGASKTEHKARIATWYLENPKRRYGYASALARPKPQACGNQGEEEKSTNLCTSRRPSPRLLTCSSRMLLALLSYPQPRATSSRLCSPLGIIVSPSLCHLLPFPSSHPPPHPQQCPHLYCGTPAGGGPCPPPPPPPPCPPCIITAWPLCPPLICCCTSGRYLTSCQ